jgi:hypothetical protein
MKRTAAVKVSAQSITAQEATKFLRTHSPGTVCYLVGEGAAAVGFQGECVVEDLLRIVANPEHADRSYVSILLVAPEPDGDLMTACHGIWNAACVVEAAHVRGFAVDDDKLLSVPCGMVAGLIYHEYSRDRRQPHGHLIVFPQVVRESRDGQAVFHQLDANNLLKSITG